MDKETIAAAGASPPDGGGGAIADAAGKLAAVDAKRALEITELMQLGVIANIPLAEVNGWVKSNKTVIEVRDLLIDRAAEAAAKVPAVNSGTLAEFDMTTVPANILVDSMKRMLVERGLKPNGN